MLDQTAQCMIYTMQNPLSNIGPSIQELNNPFVNCRLASQNGHSLKSIKLCHLVLLCRLKLYATMQPSVFMITTSTPNAFTDHIFFLVHF